MSKTINGHFQGKGHSVVKRNFSPVIVNEAVEKKDTTQKLFAFFWNTV